MRFVVEKWDNTLYTYFADEDHYRNTKAEYKEKGLTKLSKKSAQLALADINGMDEFPDNTYFVLKLKNKKEPAIQLVDLMTEFFQKL